jgi:bile acid:Na+ symporter, BASS family
MRRGVHRVYGVLHRHLIWCLLLVYALGALGLPGSAWLDAGAGTALGGRWPLRVLLSVILFNAGLGVALEQLRHVGRHWRLLAAGWIAGIVLPMTLVVVAGLFLAWSRLPQEYLVLLVGFAVVAAMPVAGASAAWAQNAEANLALSLGLVLLSTLASPLSTAAVLALTVSWLADDVVGPIGGAPHTTAWFLALWVVAPAVAGLGARLGLGTARVEHMKPYLKLINLAALLLLYYFNAALTLPEVLAFQSVTVIVTAVAGAAAVAATVFLGSELLARGFQLERPERASLLFGLALKNNGAAMVLVSTVLVSQELALLPILAYSLAQNVGAAMVDRWVPVVGDGERALPPQDVVAAEGPGAVYGSTGPDPASDDSGTA